MLTEGFMTHPSISTKYYSASLYDLQRIGRQGLTFLQMAKRSNPKSAAGNKGKNKSNKNRKNKSTDTRKGDKSAKQKGGDGGASNNKNNGAKATQHLPPWQVMSNKDIEKNIKSEKIRREGIRNGEISSSVTALTEKTGDVKASLLKPTDRQLMNWKRFSPDKDIGGIQFSGAYLGRQLPPELGCPEVAFLGRSNVGKSSLLNRLVKGISDGGVSSPGNSGNDLARVGKTPGATASGK